VIAKRATTRAATIVVAPAPAGAETPEWGTRAVAPVVDDPEVLAGQVAGRAVAPVLAEAADRALAQANDPVAEEAADRALVQANDPVAEEAADRVAVPHRRVPHIRAAVARSADTKTLAPRVTRASEARRAAEGRAMPAVAADNVAVAVEEEAAAVAVAEVAAADVEAVAVAAGAAAAGDVKKDRTMRTHFDSLVRFATPIVVLIALASPGAAAADSAQKTFPKPEQAVLAIVDAARANNQAELTAILGPGSEDVVSSGDPVADRAALARFVTAAKQHTRFETLPSGAVIVHVGKDDWPMPIPLVKDGDAWRFNTKDGRDELLNRRIGRNELKVIEVCRVYVNAQREHVRLEHVFAQKLRSDAGKHDGLYWDDPTGKHPSPFGPFLAEASAEGYATPGEPASPEPYHGYLYHILTEQGASAPGGAKSYVKDGQMTGGFALLAYPAEHGSSGVMTFVVGPEGIVYQKDLGDKTADAAKAITKFDPDDSWTPVRD